MPTPRYPFPIPFGWFCVGYPEDFPVGEPKPLYYFGRHLVGWRDDEPARSTCRTPSAPTSAPTSGHGGHVDGCEIVCPFHGWKYDAEGANTAIPYSERLNRKARLAHVPHRRAQRRGPRLVPPRHGEAPQWDVPEVPELAGHPDWSTTIRTSYVIDACAAGDGGELGRLRPLPLRPQHGHGARRSTSTRRASPRRSCGRRRSSPRPGG